jgi:hypothetical protein
MTGLFCKHYYFAILFSFVIFGGLLINPNTAYGQDTEFEKWKKQQQQEFKEYQDQFDKEFIEMLEKTWEEVGINKGSDFYRERKPEDIPEAPEKPVVTEQNTIDDTPIQERINFNLSNLPEPDPVSERPRETQKQNLYTDIPVVDISLNFFSETIPFQYPARLRELYKPGAISSSKIDNDKIAEFWDEVSRIDHTPIINYLSGIRRDLELNDWGFLLLINDFSEKVYSRHDKKLVNLYNWFLLTRAGYKVKVGYDQHNVYLLFTVRHKVFNTNYYTLDGEAFYIINLNDSQQNPSSIFTYSGNHQGQNKRIDLSIDALPRFSKLAKTERKTLEFEYQDSLYSIPVSVDKNLIDYFEYYPVTELPLYFNAAMGASSKKNLYAVLAPAIKNMNEVEAVNFLLSFVQKAFAYKTDQLQFNREKYMLPEETLYYPYSDCDDRAILFANLVEDLTGLEVVGLRYSQHLATGVAFKNSVVQGDFHSRFDIKYFVADPTYVNAPVGLTMSRYQNETPEIISLN